MDKKKTQGIAWAVIVIVGIGVAFLCVSLIFNVATGGTSEGYFRDSSGESNKGMFIALFWTLIVAIIVFILAGGSFKRFLGNNKED